MLPLTGLRPDEICGSSTHHSRVSPHASFKLRLSIRPSTLALLTASAFVFIGLYVAERSLSHSERANIQADAQESAEVVSSYLSVREEGLQALHAFYIDESLPPDSVHFARLMDALYGVGQELRSIWLTDSAGVVVRQHYYGEANTDFIIGLDVDTVSYLSIGVAAATARESRQPSISMSGELFGGDSGAIIFDPLVVDGVFRGHAGGIVTTAQLRELFSGRSVPPRRLSLAIVADSLNKDTIVTISATGVDVAATRVAMAPIELPGGERWWIAHRYVARSPVRVQLWAVALAALGALALGAWHERRQTRRIADRSRELELLSQELLRSNRAKSEFLANVSHELRTPLNAVVGFTELLRDGVYGELTPRQSGPVGRIEASASHLRELVDQVLDLAKIAAGRLEVNAEMVELRQFVLDVASEIEPLLTEKSLGFSLDMGAGTPRLATDPSSLRQILLNLLANAANFTEHGSVTVRTRVIDSPGPGVAAGLMVAAGALGAISAKTTLTSAMGPSRNRTSEPGISWVTIQVCDTGPGIAHRDQERIFDEFEQVNAGSRGGAERRGTGLGLSISRRLAQLLGGDLTVESELGRGSTFTVWLPIR